MKKVYPFILSTICLIACQCVFAQGNLKGTVQEKKSHMPIPYCTIMVYSGSNLLAETQTDSAGNYSIENLKPDTVKISCVAKSFRKQVIKGVLIVKDKISFVDFELNK